LVAPEEPCIRDTAIRWKGSWFRWRWRAT